MTKWEYLTVNRFDDVKKLGPEGWELAGVVYEPRGVWPHTFYLKRPKVAKPKSKKKPKKGVVNDPEPIYENNSYW